MRSLVLWCTDSFLILFALSISVSCKKPLVLLVHKGISCVVSMQHFSKKFIEFLFWLDILLAQIQKSNISRRGFPRESVAGIPFPLCISKVC